MNISIEALEQLVGGPFCAIRTQKEIDASRKYVACRAYNTTREYFLRYCAVCNPPMMYSEEMVLDHLRRHDPDGYKLYQDWRSKESEGKE
jgi:hypothetical protein